MKLFGSCNFDIRFFSSTLGALSRPTSNLKFSFETRFDRAVLYFEGKVFLRVVSETRLLSTLVSDTSLMLIAKMKRLVLRHVSALYSNIFLLRVASILGIYRFLGFI